MKINFRRRFLIEFLIIFKWFSIMRMENILKKFNCFLTFFLSIFEDVFFDKNMRFYGSGKIKIGISLRSLNRRYRYEIVFSLYVPLKFRC